jgi:hypothetical protein
VNRQPNFITIGAMKSATSTLHEQLKQQPGFFMSEEKEPNFFSNDEIYANGLDWYSSLFSNAAPGDLCGESSTHYTKLTTYPHTVARMKAALPHVKLIYMIRHPIDRPNIELSCRRFTEVARLTTPTWTMTSEPLVKNNMVN